MGFRLAKGIYANDEKPLDNIVSEDKVIEDTKTLEIIIEENNLKPETTDLKEENIENIVEEKIKKKSTTKNALKNKS